MFRAHLAQAVAHSGDAVSLLGSRVERMPCDSTEVIASLGAVPATTVLLSPSGRGLGTTSSLSFRYAFRFECQTCFSDCGVNFTDLTRDVGEARVGEMEKAWEPLRGREVFEVGEFSADVRALLVEDEDRDNPPPHAAGWRLRDAALQSRRGLGGDTGWRLHRGEGSRAESVLFRMLQKQLMLFDTGLGYITFVTQPTTEEIGAWHDMLHYFRFFGRARYARLEMPPQRDGSKPRMVVLEDLVRGMIREIGVASRLPPEQAPAWAEPADLSGQLSGYTAFCACFTASMVVLRGRSAMSTGRSQALRAARTCARRVVRIVTPSLKRCAR